MYSYQQWCIYYWFVVWFSVWMRSHSGRILEPQHFFPLTFTAACTAALVPTWVLQEQLLQLQGRRVGIWHCAVGDADIWWAGGTKWLMLGLSLYSLPPENNVTSRGFWLFDLYRMSDFLTLEHISVYWIYIFRHTAISRPGDLRSSGVPHLYWSQEYKPWWLQTWDVRKTDNYTRHVGVIYLLDEQF